MLNPDSWNWGAKAGFFWAGTGMLCAVWTYFRVPEPKGRTYAEMDMLFEARTSARKFKETSVDSFVTAGHVGDEKGGFEDMKMASEYVDKVEG
jgi:SP family general alpha glucoside:H+ symporter-like MFS transporter